MSMPPDVNCTDSNGNTPLIRASLQDNRDMAVVLIQNGADVEIRNDAGETAQSVAKSTQMKELLEVMFKWGCPILVTIRSLLIPTHTLSSHNYHR